MTSLPAEQARWQTDLGGQITVFLHTSPFRKQDKQYSRSMTVPLRRPTDDSMLVQAAVIGLRAIYRPISISSKRE